MFVVLKAHTSQLIIHDAYSAHFPMPIQLSPSHSTFSCFPTHLTLPNSSHYHLPIVLSLPLDYCTCSPDCTSHSPSSTIFVLGCSASSYSLPTSNSLVIRITIGRGVERRVCRLLGGPVGPPEGGGAGTGAASRVARVP